MIAEMYRNIGISNLYYIVSINNLTSIFNNGILSKNLIISKNIKYDDISNEEVQNIRNKRHVFDYELHDYVNLFINPRNSMMYSVQHNKGNSILSVLEINIDILNDSFSAVSDGNCASDNTKYYRSIDGYHNIDCKSIFKNYWVRPDGSVDNEQKRIISAEALVLNNVPFKYINRIIVNNNNTKEIIDSMNLGVEVVTSRWPFFYI